MVTCASGFNPTESSSLVLLTFRVGRLAVLCFHLFICSVEGKLFDAEVLGFGMVWDTSEPQLSIEGMTFRSFCT